MLISGADINMLTNVLFFLVVCILLNQIQEQFRASNEVNWLNNDVI